MKGKREKLYVSVLEPCFFAVGLRALDLGSIRFGKRRDAASGQLLMMMMLAQAIIPYPRALKRRRATVSPAAGAEQRPLVGRTTRLLL